MPTGESMIELMKRAPEIEDAGPWGTDEPGEELEMGDGGQGAGVGDGADAPKPESDADALKPVAAETTGAEEPKAEPDAASLEAAEKARNYDTFSNTFARDPVGLMNTLSQSLTPEQRVQLAVQMGFGLDPGAGNDPRAETGLSKDFVPTTELEELLVGQLDHIRGVPKLAQDFEQSRQQYAQAFNRHAQVIDDAAARVAVLEAKLASVLDLLDAKLPDADIEAIKREMYSKGGTWEDVVKGHYSPKAKQHVTLAKQEKKPRPETPGDSGLTAEKVRPGMGMTDILRMIR